MENTKPVLVIDDEENIREFISMTLTDEGYYVVTASNGKVALEILEDIEPQLILLDMRMPEMDGWEFSKAYYKKSYKKAPIVVLTAATDAAKFAAQIKADAFLPKPFDLDDLISIVGKFAHHKLPL